MRVRKNALLIFSKPPVPGLVKTRLSTLKDGALLAVVFNEVKDDRLVLAASVGSPDAMSDDYVPFIISISRMGDVHIEKDNHPDEIPDAEQNAQQDTEDEEDGV